MAEVWNEIVSGNYISGYLTDSLISILMILCFFDVMLGILTAIRRGDVNSTIGLNGIIRKVVIIVSLLFLHMLDILCGINLISFFPQNFKDWLQATLQINSVGIAGLFGVYIILFELLSILKNWEDATNIKIPSKIKRLLRKISSEVQKDEEDDGTTLEDIEAQFDAKKYNDSKDIKNSDIDTPTEEQETVNLEPIRPSFENEDKGEKDEIKE